ncbi:MAG: hypothetical protein HY814_10590 [Candidatus Riflebacteria bacterium]|nr:hypothetical protein [Candidatus Riflebacteria bacterium]
MNTIRRFAHPVVWLLVWVMLGTLGAPIVMAQDADAAATQQYMQQRLQALSAQQQALAAQLEQARQSDPARAEYLARLMQENQVLAQRYDAYLQGQPDPLANQMDSAPVQGQPTDAGAQAADPNAGQQEGGLGGMLKNLMGGGETSTTDIIIQIAAGFGGWYLGKMAFGPIGGIVGGFVAPMLAKWLTGIIKEKMGKGTDGGSGTNQQGVPMAMPGATTTAQGAPGYSAQKAAVQSESVAKAKSQLDAAYLALQDGIQRGLAPAAIAQRRNIYEQWRLTYNNALAGQ